MAELKENDRIRVVKLLDSKRVLVGPKRPTVGDVAIIRLILRDKIGKVIGYVAVLEENGQSAWWMGSLTVDEVEPA